MGESTPDACYSTDYYHICQAGAKVKSIDTTEGNEDNEALFLGLLL